MRKLADITKNYIDKNIDCLQIVHDISKEQGKKVKDMFRNFRLDDKSYLEWYKQTPAEEVNETIISLFGDEFADEVNINYMRSGDIVLVYGPENKLFIVYYVGNLTGLVATFKHGVKVLNISQFMKSNKILKVVRLRNEDAK